jgi:hypothetical protein
MHILYSGLVAAILIQSQSCKLRGLVRLFAQLKGWMTLRLPKVALTIVLAFVIFFPATTRAQSPRDYLIFVFFPHGRPSFSVLCMTEISARGSNHYAYLFQPGSDRIPID